MFVFRFVENEIEPYGGNVFLLKLTGGSGVVSVYYPFITISNNFSDNLLTVVY